MMHDPSRPRKLERRPIPIARFRQAWNASAPCLSVFGSGSHDKTGRHCQATDTNGKLDIASDAGFWLRDENGKLTKAFKHICWDGCMFPNEVMNRQQTWNDILATMIKVREQHGWYQAD